MTIVDNRLPLRKAFGATEGGEVFDYNGNFYVRIAGSPTNGVNSVPNAVSLSTGAYAYFSASWEVTPIPNAKLELT